VKSAAHNSNRGSRVLHGTSMATPHVAGAAALMLQANPIMKPAEVDAKLKEYATRTEHNSITPGLLLYVTDYTSTTTTPPPSPTPSLPAPEPASVSLIV